MLARTVVETVCYVFAVAVVVPEIGAANCIRTDGADARCCNLTTADEYSRLRLLGSVYADLDLADYSMAIAAGIGCCSNNGAPCRACIQGLSPGDLVNQTMATKNLASVNRLVGILSRWRCFGGNVAASPSDFPTSLGDKQQELQHIANGGCTCADCPSSKCNNDEGNDWLLSCVLPATGGVALLAVLGCLYRRRARLAANSVQSNDELTRPMTVKG